ncbi:glutaminase [Desulfuromonas versatilis]|uniref:Glutaminase n=1 Tax=Desulfuromonas versatilis TaxID=2802975 RepID=A0ABN6DWP3_9BACT|nr:glutaminase [Desulfuromonas versatilis]BCR04546.1 glutaminase [Desulfuromonas versatilis]
MDYQEILEEIQSEITPFLRQGEVATYIPQLACVPITRFGMAVRTVDGRLFQVGAAAEPFSIQSISKVMSLTLAMTLVGDGLWQRVGREPSGTAFNSLVQLEYENGIPRNPFINAGALVVTDVILSRLRDAKGTVRDFVRELSGNPAIDFDPEVVRSEKGHGHRNAALAHFIKSFGNLENPAEEVLDAYFHHCSLAMSCADLAEAFLYLANGGFSPATERQVTTPSQAKYINSLMLTCGVYDAAGDFAYRVGLPGKSGVGGGIAAVMPQRFAVCVWSPGLNPYGNSLAGTKALELFTTKTGISIF